MLAYVDVWIVGVVVSLALAMQSMNNRDDMYPSQKAAWIVVIILLGVVGLFLYAWMTEARLKK